MRYLFLIFVFCMQLAVKAQQTEIIYLSGTGADHTVDWKFQCSNGMDSGKWDKIAVPSCWEQQGYGEYTYGRYYKKPNGIVSNETARYIHTFIIPKEWSNKRVEIVFEGVMTDATVLVNGITAGPTHQGGFTSFCYDISNMLHYGKDKNTLEVLVKKQSDDASVNSAERRADWWLFGGIYRPVYLRALPKTCINRTDVDARGDGTLHLRIHTQGLAAGYKLQATIVPSDKSEDKKNYAVNTVNLTGNEMQTVQMKWDGVKTWDTEHPFLYDIMMSLVSPNGTVVHKTAQRVGFRTIEFRSRDGFYLNSRKLTIKGVNRHCFYPETGRTTCRAWDEADLKLIKGMNANAIRSHYPPDKHLLDLCDSLGILYFDELPGWQNHYSTAAGKRILGEMLAHDANHPCIFAWGNGNEGGFNLNLDSLFAQYDLQQRHVVHPWACFNGVDAHHYPAYQTGVARLANGYNVFMPTEFLHAQYDKGAGSSLDDYWSSWSRNPLFAGGFIWAWVDEGVARTDSAGLIDTDGGNAPDGIVGPHREREGSWYTIRDVWCPIQISPIVVRPAWNGCFIVQNKLMFSRLDEIKMKYQVECVSTTPQEEKSSVIAEGAVSLPSIDPNESGTARIASTDALSKGDILKLIAYTHNGDTMNIWTYPLRYADEYFANHKPFSTHSMSSAACCEGDNSLVAPCGLRVSFDKTTGFIESVTLGKKQIPFGGGPLPVGMKMRLLSMETRQDGGDALIVMRYAGAADSIVWRMTSDGKLGMDALILNTRKGKNYEGEFFDSKVRNLGFSFTYPETAAKGVRWLGKGPYRVWRNRLRGPVFGLWQKDYNNTVTGESTTRLVYPEFKGYHANLYWAEVQSEKAPWTVYSETDGLYLRLFTPEEPKNAKEHTMESFPDGDISFLLEIPAMRSYKPIEQLGPDAQPSNIRINKGDDGIRIKLWFDFTQSV